MTVQKNSQPASHSYVSQHLRLNYCAWGKPGRPALLLVHGMQDHARTWDWLAAAFADDFYIIAPDLRGHGDSQWALGACYSQLDYVYDLNQLIAQLQLDSVTLLGHSLGGTLVSLYAGSRPETVKRLISIEGIGLWAPDEADRPTPAEMMDEWLTSTETLFARAPRRYASLDDACARMQKMNPNLSVEQVRHLTRFGSRQNDDGSWSWKFDNCTQSWPPFRLPDTAICGLWENISAPTLLLNADNGYEHRMGQDGSLQHFRHAQLHTIANAGHWTYHDQLDDVVRLTRDFLSGER